MQVQYHPLLRLKLQHDYFPEGNCPTVRAIPTRETQAVMQRLGIRLVNREFGEELFYSNGSNSQGRLLDEAKDQVIRLSFILRNSDPIFYNYTVLPTELFNGSIPYYSNLTGSNDFEVHNLPLLPAAPAHSQIRANSPGSKLEVFNELGTSLFHYPESTEDESYQPITPLDEDEESFSLNLSGESPGKYSLKEKDELHSTFLYQPANWKKGDLGVVTLYLGDTGDTGVHILNNGSVEPASFTVTFKARATTWRYHFIDAQGMYEGFKLFDKRTNTVAAEQADPPLTRQLPDGSHALVLSSPEAIPLRQRPGQVFELSARAKGSNRELTISLPSADTNRISREEDTIYSDIYVYL